MDDPRRIHAAKQRVEERFARKSTDELALAAAVNTELLLEEADRQDKRIESLETWRSIVVGGLIVLAVVVLPIFLGVVTGRV